MIEWNLDSAGRPAVMQVMTHPAVYLDHWAIMKFSGEPKLAMRFTNALKSSQGTWAISLSNLMEFIKMTDESQAVQFEKLIELALPNIFFIDFDPFDVMERECVMLQGGSQAAPYGDVSFLGIFAAKPPDTPRPFTAKNLVTVIIKQSGQLQNNLEILKDTIISKTQLMREQMLVDKQFEKSVKGSQKSAKVHRTWFFLRELLRNLLLDKTKVVRSNDAMDLLHAIVPITYCDFVLLDAQWEDRVKAISKRLIDQNIEIKLADIFSDKEGGSRLEQFFGHLENSNKSEKLSSDFGC